MLETGAGGRQAWLGGGIAKARNRGDRETEIARKTMRNGIDVRSDDG
jgi:hypothetical protein